MAVVVPPVRSGAEHIVEVVGKEPICNEPIGAVEQEIEIPVVEQNLVEQVYSRVLFGISNLLPNAAHALLDLLRYGYV